MDMFPAACLHKWSRILKGYHKIKWAPITAQARGEGRSLCQLQMDMDTFMSNLVYWMTWFWALREAKLLIYHTNLHDLDLMVLMRFLFIQTICIYNTAPRPTAPLPHIHTHPPSKHMHPHSTNTYAHKSDYHLIATGIQSWGVGGVWWVVYLVVGVQQVGGVR